MRWKRCSILIIIFFAGFFIWANALADCVCPPPILTLKEAIFLSLRFNPLVRNAELQRIVDKFAVLNAQYPYQLQYSLVAGLNYTNTTSNNIHSESTFYNFTPGVSYMTPMGTQINITEANNFSHIAGQPTFFNPLVTAVITQPLLRGYGPAVVLAPLHNAYDQELINRLTLKNQIISNITTVITQYTSLILAQNTLTSLKLALKASLDTVDQYKAEIKAGRRAPADIVQFEVNVAQQQLSIEQQLVTIQAARLTLLGTLGLDPTINLEVPTTTTIDDKCLPTLQQSIDVALKNNVPYQQQRIGVRLLVRNLLVQRDNQRWQLNATVTQTFGGGSGGGPNAGFRSLVNGQNKSTNVMLNLNVPIHNVPLQFGLVQAKIALEQAQINLAAARRLVIANTINAYNTMISTKLQIDQAQKAMDLATITLNNANIRLNFGRSTPFEVATLQNNLTNAQIALITAQVNYVNSVATFEQTIGITLDRWCVKISY